MFILCIDAGGKVIGGLALLVMKNISESNIFIIVVQAIMQEQRNYPQQQSQPKKRLKKDLTSLIANQAHEKHTENQNNVFCKCYNKNQIDQILSAISGFQNYTKYISVLIRHQQKSLAILPRQLLETKQFVQLGQRVSKCIARARYNNQLLTKIIKNYSQYLHDTLSLQNIDNRASQGELTPNAVLNVFSHIVKQWSNISESTKQPMYRTADLMKKYQQQNGMKDVKVFVQGAGMGRVMCQIYEKLGEDVVGSIEGCQDRVLHYICGEYFLANYKGDGKGDQIYPFIHDFSNKYQAEDAYQPVTVPYWPYPTQKTNKIGSKQEHPLFLTLTQYQQYYYAGQYTNTYNYHISYFCTDRVINLLKWIQIVYKNLVQGGIWIIVCYSSFQRNVVPITFGELMDILRKTQFKVLEEIQNWEEIVCDRGMTKEKILAHYIVLRK